MDGVCASSCFQSKRTLPSLLCHSTVRISEGDHFSFKQANFHNMLLTDVEARSTEQSTSQM
eukprot:214949-Amphidinium_carterae.1